VAGQALLHGADAVARMPPRMVQDISPNTLIDRKGLVMIWNVGEGEFDAVIRSLCGQLNSIDNWLNID